MICNYYGDQITEHEMGGICGIHG